MWHWKISSFGGCSSALGERRPHQTCATSRLGDRLARFGRTIGDRSAFNFCCATLGGRSARFGRTTDDRRVLNFLCFGGRSPKLGRTIGSCSACNSSCFSFLWKASFFVLLCLKFRASTQITCILTKLVKTHKTCRFYKNSIWKLWYMSEYIAHSSTSLILTNTQN